MASVASRNPFDLLGESEDSETVVRERELPAKEPVVVQKKVDRSRASPKEARIRHEYPQRGGHKPSASNRNNEDTRSAAPRDRNVGPRLSGRREEGGGGGGGGGGGDYHPTRSSRGARTNDRGRGGRGGRRGREYDRHSGTGRYDSEKKETQGWGNPTESYDTTETSGWGGADPNNATSNAKGAKNVKNAKNPKNASDNADGSWGNDTTNTTNTTNTTEENKWDVGGTEEKSGNDGWAVTEEATDEWVQQPEASSNWEGGDGNKTDNAWKSEDTAAAGDSAPAPEPEPEETVKTFDEYLAEKAQKSLDISLPEARRPNEGADDSQWKDAVPLEKAEEDDFLFTGKEQSYRLKSKKSKAKTVVEITQTFVERPGGGSSRGRGRGRGNRGRGGRDEREGRSNSNYEGRRGGGGGGGRGVVNLDDQSAFPSLGAPS